MNLEEDRIEAAYAALNLVLANFQVIDFTKTVYVSQDSVKWPVVFDLL